VEREALKAALREIARSEPEFIVELLRAVLPGELAELVAEAVAAALPGRASSARDAARLAANQAAARPPAAGGRRARTRSSILWHSPA
jgi:hypothetical protein